ncbi:hypothetical protein QUA35_06695 [Microcoleus sp. N9_B2]|uniref:hypothetical protein n=1 Tax=unclassified Microcoleus TaxID=2642155 RepID=UPI002FD57C3E
MARYADINRAEELMAAKTKLEAWRRLDAAAKRAAYQAARLGLKINVGSSLGWIKPFGETNNFYWETKILAVPTAAPKPEKEENNNSLITNVRTAVIGAGAAADTKPTTANVSIKRARKIELARVLCTVAKAQTKDAISRTTGKPYTLVETDTVSCAFGQTEGADNEKAVQDGIRAALKLTQSTARISFKPQGYVG